MKALKVKRGRPALGKAARVRSTYTLSREALLKLGQLARQQKLSRSRVLESAVLGGPAQRPFRPDFQALSGLCQRRGIEAMWLFGSALGPAFRPDSDIDLLVRFREGACGSYFEFADIQAELEAVLGRKVDLVEEKLLDNPIRRAEIMATREALYAS